MDEASYPLPSPLITISPEWLSGAPVFTGRRVMVKTLFDYLKSGHTLDEFLDDFPSVSRSHAVAVIDLANQVVATPAQAA